MAWTKENWDSFKKARLDGPYYRGTESTMARLLSPGEKYSLKALRGLKRRQSASGKKRKQKQSWNYG